MFRFHIVACFHLRLMQNNMRIWVMVTIHRFIKKCQSCQKVWMGFWVCFFCLFVCYFFPGSRSRNSSSVIVDLTTDAHILLLDLQVFAVLLYFSNDAEFQNVRLWTETGQPGELCRGVSCWNPWMLRAQEWRYDLLSDKRNGGSLCEGLQICIRFIPSVNTAQSPIVSKSLVVWMDEVYIRMFFSLRNVN